MSIARAHLVSLAPCRSGALRGTARSGGKAGVPGARAAKTPRRGAKVLANAGSGGDPKAAYPVFEKMVGKWDDSVRYVHANMNETPRIQLKGTREVKITPQGTVTLRSSTTFPDGKVLELSFVGERVQEAFGLKDVVKFERVANKGEEAKPKGYYPIVLLASEHPNLDDQKSWDHVVVREVMADTGRVLLSETITLIPGSVSPEGDAPVLESAHVAQEVKEDGSLGGVQLWRSTMEVDIREKVAAMRIKDQETWTAMNVESTAYRASPAKASSSKPTRLGAGVGKGSGPSRTGPGGGPGGNNNAVPSKAGAGKAISGGSGATVVRLNLLPEEDDAVLEG